MAPPRSTCQASPARRRPALSRALFSLPGGYDGNDVQFSWLRGNDSVRGLENLRLAQYTIQRYFTSVTRSQQETGNSGDELGDSYRTSCIPRLFFALSLWAQEPVCRVAGPWGVGWARLPAPHPVP